MKIVMTANENISLGKLIKERYPNEEIVFCSLSTGYDLKTEQGRLALCEETLSCDVFINSANLGRKENYQCVILQEVYAYWKEHKKEKGMIINIGSERAHRRHAAHLYNANKRALRDLVECIRLEQSNYKVSLLSPGLFDSPFTKDVDEPKLELEKIGDAFEFIINQPDDIAVTELRIEKWVK